MSNISIRLPELVLRQLVQESKRTHRKRSEIIRDAVVQYLDQAERNRFMNEMVEEAKVLYGNADQVDEALGITAEFDESDDARVENEERWWK